MGHRQAHGHLAVGLFAELAAVLMSDPDRVRALFRKAGIIHHPDLNRTLLLEGRECIVTDSGQDGGIVPVGVGHQVMQRLVAGTDVLGIDAGRHGFDAFPFSGQQQAGGVKT